jgi:hypothetical protein
MSIRSQTEVARFETTRRLLSHLVNEGLCAAYLESADTEQLHWMRLVSFTSQPPEQSMVKVRIEPAQLGLNENGQVHSLLRPCQLRPPVLLFENLQSRSELDPGIIFKFVFPWFAQPEIESMRHAIAQELQNASANQGRQVADRVSAD